MPRKKTGRAGADEAVASELKASQETVKEMLDKRRRARSKKATSLGKKAKSRTRAMATELSRARRVSAARVPRRTRARRSRSSR